MDGAVIVTGAAADPEPNPEASLELAQTVGSLEATQEHQAAEIEEIEQTAEQAEQIAETAVSVAFASMEQLQDLRSEISSMVAEQVTQQLLAIQESEEEAGHENEAVEILELPTIEEVPADLPAHNKGGILGFLGRVIH